MAVMGEMRTIGSAFLQENQQKTRTDKKKRRPRISQTENDKKEVQKVDAGSSIAERTAAAEGTDGQRQSNW